MKIRKIHIEDYKIFKDFEIDLTNEGKPLSIVAVAGINGSGKSTLLDYIYQYLGFKKEEFIHKGFIVGDLFNSESDKYIINEKINQIQFAGEVLKYPDLNRPIYFKPNVFEKKKSTSAIIKYIDKLIYEKDIKSSEVYELVRKKLHSILEGFDLQVEFNLLDKERKIFFKNEKSERIPIYQLSGGEQELITKAFTLYISDIRNKVILIDEPESSLHPNWQNRILKIYEDFAKENNNQIILATHSPQIIASAKKESLRLLVKKGEKIEVVSDFNGSYGYEVQRVLLEIMNLKSLRIPGIDEKIETLHELVHNNRYNTDRFVKLMAEMEGLLGKNDKDLMLLRLEIAKRNKINEKNK